MARALPQYTNNYEFEPMDLDGDGFLDLVTMNDGEIVAARTARAGASTCSATTARAAFATPPRRGGRPPHNVGEDDNMVAFLDYDSDGDADFVVGSLSGPDRLLINDGKGRLTVALDVFDGEPTPGTLGLALADLDGDGRMDVVQGQGEHKTATDERVFSGRGLKPDTAAPSVTLVASGTSAGTRVVRARVHDRKSPSLATEWKRVAVEWTTASGRSRRCRCDGTASTCGGPTGRRRWIPPPVIACARPMRRATPRVPRRRRDSSAPASGRDQPPVARSAGEAQHTARRGQHQRVARQRHRAVAGRGFPCTPSRTPSSDTRRACTPARGPPSGSGPEMVNAPLQVLQSARVESRPSANDKV